MEPLCTTAEIREFDRQTIEDLGVPGVVLMENAGRATTDIVRREYERVTRGARGAPTPVAILCGAGNNGGDGYVVARHLHQAGVPCTVYLASAPDRIRGDARINLDVVDRLPIDVVPVANAVAVAAAGPAIRSAPVVVDALLGTGLSKDVGGVYRDLVELANAGVGRRVAVDIPSGIRADDGAVLGVAFRADITATYAAAKLGLLLHPGADHAGTVVVVDIGIPPQVVAAVAPQADRIRWAEVLEAFRPRPRAGHKGTFGHCLVVAGTPGKSGAALLAGHAALRGGAGLVTVATDKAVQARLEGRVPALMVEWVREAPDDAVDDRRVEALLTGKQAAVIGPGLGTDRAIEALVVDTARLAEVPLVLDADALNVLAGHRGALRSSPAERILTPHPGEMGRLLGCSAAEVQADRLGAARRLAERERAIVVLKGARTLVAHSDGRVAVNTTGNPGLGTAGTGDVLSGLLGALLAQGLSAWQAARVAVHVHGAAGDDVAAAVGERALTADALLDALPAVLGRAEGDRGAA